MRARGRRRDDATKDDEERDLDGVGSRGGDLEPSAAEQTAKAAAAAAGELCDEVLRVQTQFLQQARVLVGVDLLGQLLVGPLGLGLIALGKRSRSRIWLLSICMMFSLVLDVSSS